ncbi:hypothetical protein LT015_17520, partial [Vibrio cholerae]|nr:hypothetical protein [Vibrio cholerae]
YRIDVPDELIVQLENEDLPNNWRAIPASEQTQEIGDQFLKCVIHRHPFNYTGCLWTEKSNKDYSG